MFIAENDLKRTRFAQIMTKNNLESSILKFQSNSIFLQSAKSISCFYTGDNETVEATGRSDCMRKTWLQGSSQRSDRQRSDLLQGNLLT